MKRPNLFIVSLASMGGLVAYVAAVAWVMNNAERIFGRMPNVLGPVAFLLMFVLSATVTGSLFLGYPAYLLFEKRKAEALRLFLMNIAVLFALTVSVFLLIWAVVRATLPAG